MPELETPSKPPSTPQSDGLVRTGRFGEMEHHELIRLLDTLDDERSKSRFRESIYISVFVYLALAWFVFYGPKILFHQGQIVNPADVLKQRDEHLAYLNLPKDLTTLPPPKKAKAISDHTTRAQTAKPTLDNKTLEQLQAMQRAGAPGRTAPAPPQPQQQALPQPQKPAPATPEPAAPTPQPSNIPDSPRPAQTTQPSFATPASPGDSIRQAANDAARGAGGNFGANAPRAHNGANTGVEVLSDTLGVDFGPYIKRILRMIYNSWVPLIPEETRPPLNKEGSTLIRFTIGKNGIVTAMTLDASTHDQAIDRAAWGGIQGVGQFPPLPANFQGPNLELRIQFSVTHERRKEQ
jgi:TonB family protein